MGLNVEGQSGTDGQKDKHAQGHVRHGQEAVLLHFWFRCAASLQSRSKG